MFNLSKHAPYTQAPHILEICKPLQIIGINHFFFHRVYSTGFIIHLSTDLDWATFFLNNLLALTYEKSDITDHFFIEANINIWEMNPQKRIWQEGQGLFRRGNGITLVSQENKNYKETGSFYGSVTDNALNQFYLNHLDLLHNFIMYFKDCAYEIILEAENTKIPLPVKYRVNQEEKTGKDWKIQKHQFISAIKPHRYFINENWLTEREAEILHWSVKGKTSEEIAIILNISRRTTEKHLENMKNKFRFHTKSDLIVYLLYLCLKYLPSSLTHYGS